MVITVDMRLKWFAIQDTGNSDHCFSSAVFRSRLHTTLCNVFTHCNHEMCGLVLSLSQLACASTDVLFRVGETLTVLFSVLAIGVT